MDEATFVILIEATIRQDIPLGDLRLKQKVKLAMISFQFADVKKVCYKRKQVLIPHSRIAESPLQVVNECMVEVVSLLFRKFSKFQCESLAKSWLQNPRRELENSCVS